MINQQQYQQAVEAILESQQQDLQKHDAFDMIAGNDFIAYLGKDGDMFRAEVWQWGVFKGYEYNSDLGALKETVWECYE